MENAPKAAAIVILAMGLGLLLSACDSIGEKYVGFAQCLGEKNVKMYGAYWCPHCTAQKAIFGEQGAKALPYIECDPNGKNAQPQLCAEKKITGYPTWGKPDGTFANGEQTLEQLAEISGCELPKE